MPPFKTNSGQDFPERVPAKEDSYRLVIEKYRMAKTRPSQWDEGGRDQIQFICDFVAIADDPDAEILDLNDRPLDPEHRVLFFFDPLRTGLKPKVSKNRKFISDVLQVPIETEIAYDSYEELADDFVGREFLADVDVTTKADGRRFNGITATRPVRKRTKATRERVEKPNLVEAAAEVFPDAEVVDTPETAPEDADY